MLQADSPRLFDFKFVSDVDEWEMYDLKNDPSELNSDEKQII